MVKPGVAFVAAVKVMGKPVAAVFVFAVTEIAGVKFKLFTCISTVSVLVANWPCVAQLESMVWMMRLCKPALTARGAQVTGVYQVTACAGIGDTGTRNGQRRVVVDME
jgi:hypothetical protein